MPDPQKQDESRKDPWKRVLQILEEEGVTCPGPTAQIEMARTMGQIETLMQTRDTMTWQAVRDIFEAYYMSLQAVLNITAMHQGQKMVELRALLEAHGVQMPPPTPDEVYAAEAAEAESECGPTENSN